MSVIARGPVRRFSSSLVGSEPFRKFSTLLDSSTAYKSNELDRYGPICTVLTMELLQFYYGRNSFTSCVGFGSSEHGPRRWWETVALTLTIRSMSRVEKRRSDGSLPVATGGAFATPPQSGLT